MPRRYEAIEMTRQFLESVHGLCEGQPDLARRVDSTLDTLCEHPESPGLHREPIRRLKSRKTHSCRVTRDIRLLDEEVAPTRVRALYVDRHDAAYRWVDRYHGSTDDDIIDRRVSQTVEDRAVRGDIATPSPHELMRDDVDDDDPLQRLRRALPGEPDLSCIPVQALLAVGFTYDQAKRIRRAPIDAQLETYVSDPERLATIHRLYASFDVPSAATFPSTPNEPDTSAIVAEQKPADASIHAPVPIPLSSDDDVITITAPGQFGRMREVGLDRYLTLLTDEQRAIARMDQSGLMVVQGSGGSGKTTVAVHRLRFLADRMSAQPQLLPGGERRVMYVCFNKTLADAVKQMLRTLYGKQPPDHIEVCHLDLWAYSYLARKGVIPKSHTAPGEALYRSVRAKSDLEGFVANRMMKRGPNGQRDLPLHLAMWPKFIAGEIAEVIVGRDIANLEDYLAADRTGRRSGLTHAERRNIWALYEEWSQEMEQGRSVSFVNLQRLALRTLAEDSAFTPYEAVIVDEAQDITPVGLRLATQMAGQQVARMTIFADAAQSIYRTGFQWKQAELNPRGRQFHRLAHNHRNTVEIHLLASAFLGRGEVPDDPDTYVTAAPPAATGNHPVLLTCRDALEETAEVARRIQKQVEEGTPPHAIAVLAGTKNRVNEFVRALEDQRVPTQVVSRQSPIRITEPSVKVLTMHSAKGLDFPHVYLVGLTNDGVPTGGFSRQSDEKAEAESDVVETQRRLLYTAMIRAGKTLTMTTIAGREHVLLADLDERLYQR